MSGDGRIRGQEVSVFITAGGRPIRTITAVSSFEFTEKFEEIMREYLNERAPRFDEIYKGAAGKLEFDIESKDVFEIVKAVKDRAQRRTAGVKINVKCTLQFPNGDRLQVVFVDVSFGDIPLTVGASRDAYAHAALSFSVSNVQYTG